MSDTSAEQPAPTCPRCGEPCEQIDVSTREGPGAWIWGHGCSPKVSESADPLSIPMDGIRRVMLSYFTKPKGSGAPG